MGEWTVAGEGTKVEKPDSEREGEGGGRGEFLFRSCSSSRTLVPPGE